jgi:hypothetical protein
MIDLLRFQSYLSTYENDGKPLVLDPIRKKKVIMSPEEMVRQLFVNFLIHEVQIPNKHIAVERKITVNGKSFRFDILIFNRNGTARMIVECKSYKVQLRDITGIQIAKYNLALETEYLCITNGKETLVYQIDLENQSLKKLDAFPELK